MAHTQTHTLTARPRYTAYYTRWGHRAHCPPRLDTYKYGRGARTGTEKGVSDWGVDPEVKPAGEAITSTGGVGIGKG
jgi:hypothetical protein